MATVIDITGKIKNEEKFIVYNGKSYKVDDRKNTIIKVLFFPRWLYLKRSAFISNASFTARSRFFMTVFSGIYPNFTPSMSTSPFTFSIDTVPLLSSFG